MPDTNVDFSQQIKQAQRPQVVSLVIAGLCILLAAIAMANCSRAIVHVNRAAAAARNALRAPIPSATDEEDTNVTAEGARRALHEMAGASSRTGTYNATANLLTLVALAALGYGVFCLFGARASLKHTYDEAISSRDGKINFLQKDRALLVSTMNNIGDALVACDDGGRITFMNPIAEKLIGWQEADAIGKEIGRVVIAINEKTQDKVDLPVSHVLKNNIEKEIPSNILIATRGGINRPIAGRAVPVWDDGGRVTGVALVFRDISEKRGAREAIRTSEAHKDAIIENSLECVIMMDHEGRVVEFNAAAENTFGYQRSEALGRSVADLIVPPALRERHTHGFQRFLQTGTPTIIGKRIETTAVRKDGAAIPIEIAITQVPRQNPPVFATFLRDISERKAAEAALVAAKESAEAESRDKSQFLNNMSDELRTPLNAVIGYSEMLQEEINERRPQDIVPDLKKINEAGRHLLMLVTDVLDLSRIEAGKMEVYADTFDVLDLVEDVAVAARPLADKNQNRIKFTCGDSLGAMYSDRQKIRQCILYLINNACKFARERDLELRITRSGSNIKFRMADLSPGIADETTNQLADAFASAKDTSTIRFGGHGLGLVIARHLCEMLGGTLNGERQVGHSPSYTIALPDKVPAVK